MERPDRIPIDQLGEPFYEGSVQRLYAIDCCTTHMVTETTSAGSVFDVGSIFEIPGSDVARAVFRHCLYSRMADPDFWKEVSASIQNTSQLDPSLRKDLTTGLLEDFVVRGARTHHEGMIDALSGQVVEKHAPPNPSRFNVVRRYQILKPAKIEVLGNWLYDYSGFPGQDRFVVPLEVIVRFGITGASSIYKRFLAMNENERRAYESELRVSKALEAWQMLERPITDCTTKFEPEDRNLTKQEALTSSGLKGGDFAKCLKMAVLGAWAVRHLLEKIELSLWDIKWEFAKDGDDLLFVDTIDTDSFRATRCFERDGQKLVGHFNKQSIRDFYRIIHADWMNGVNSAKERAKAEGVSFTDLLIAGQQDGSYPPTPVIPEDFVEIQTAKMEAIQAYMLGRAESESSANLLETIGQREIQFYEEAGKLAEFAALNGLSR